MSFISGYSRIKEKRIEKDHELVFKSDAEGNAQFLLETYQFLNPGYPRYYKMNPLSQLGFLASEILLKESNRANEFAASEVGIVLSNATSSLDTDKNYFDSVSTIPSPSLFVYTLPNIVAGEICIRHQIKGENAFFVFEQFDPVFLDRYVNQLLAAGLVKACLAGWVEVSDHKADVLLYWVQNEKKGLAIPHTAENILKLYISESWKSSKQT